MSESTPGGKTNTTRSNGAGSIRPRSTNPIFPLAGSIVLPYRNDSNQIIDKRFCILRWLKMRSDKGMPDYCRFKTATLVA